MPRIKTVQVSASQIGGFANKANARQHAFIIDQPPPLGEDGGPTPLETLLLALSGCLISTGHIIARQKKMEITNLQVEIQGDMDMDYVAGKTTEGRAGYTDIKVMMQIEGDITPEQKKWLADEIERRCPVRDSILNPIPFSMMLKES